MSSRPHVSSALAAFALLGLAACTASPSTNTEQPVSTLDSAPVPRQTPDEVPHRNLVPGFDFGPQTPSYDPPPQCPAVLALGTGVKLAASTSEADFGLSVTHDELSVAWMTEHSGSVTIHYVDRAAATDPFGSARSLNGDFATGRVALSSDGLQLAVVDADGLGFSVMRRAARTDKFEDAEVGPFELLDAQGHDVLRPAGEHYADPLFANRDGYFIFSRVSAGGVGKVQVGSRFLPGDPFSPGVPFAEEALAPVGSKRKTLTGASADVRTLFVWDEAVSTSFVVRLSARGAIESSTVLGAARDVQPTASCRVFWFTSGSPSDILRFAAP